MPGDRPRENVSPAHEHTHRRLRRALIVGGVLVAVSSAGALAFGERRIAAEDAAYRAPAGAAVRALAAQPLGGAARHEPRGEPAAGLLRRLAAHPDQPAGRARERTERRRRAAARAAARTPGDCAPTPRETAPASCPRVRSSRRDRDRARTGARGSGRTSAVRLPLRRRPPGHAHLHPAGQAGRRTTTRSSTSTPPRALQPPVLAVTARARRDRARVHLHRPLLGPGTQRTGDLQRIRRTGVVRPAGGRSGGDQPAGAAVRRPVRC